MPIVPEDVVRAIVDAVVDDLDFIFPRHLRALRYQTLCRFSLVSRSFREVAQQHLFNRVCLDSVERSTKLLTLLRKRPALAWSIKALDLIDAVQFEPRLYEPNVPTLIARPPLERRDSRLRRLYKAISKKVMKPYKTYDNLTAWLASPGCKELLSLLCHVQDMWIDELGPSAYELSGNLFQQMSHVQSLCLAGSPQLSTAHALRATYTHMGHLQSLTILHHVHASSLLEATSTGPTDSSAPTYFHRPATLQRLFVETLPGLVELVDVAGHTSFLSSVRHLQVTQALSRSKLQQTITIAHNVLPKLHHLEIELWSSSFRGRVEDAEEINTIGISSVKSLMIHSITTDEVLRWIVHVFSLSRLANLQDLYLCLQISLWGQEYYQALARLLELDHILSGKVFASLRIVTLSVEFMSTPGTELVTGDKDQIHQALPLCYQRGVLKVDVFQ
jgi:hypothetical protein